MVNEVQTFFILPLLWRNWSSLTNIFLQMGWFNHVTGFIHHQTHHLGVAWFIYFFQASYDANPNSEWAKKKRRLIKGCSDPPFSRELDVGTSPERNVGNLLFPNMVVVKPCWKWVMMFSVGKSLPFFGKKTPKKTAGIFKNAAKSARTPWCWPSMEMFGKCHKNWFQYHACGLVTWIIPGFVVNHHGDGKVPYKNRVVGPPSKSPKMALWMGGWS